MEFIERELRGVFEIVLEPHCDDRGFFMRCFDNKVFSDSGLGRTWLQENHSYSTQKGIIRGLHYQLPPFTETKMLRCVRGAAFDVFVDLREGSPTFGKWGSVEISESNYKGVFIPAGFAHGFCALEDHTTVVYKVDQIYSPGYEGGLIWNDPDIGITWPVCNPRLSEKDRRNITMKEFTEKYHSLKV